MKVEILGENRLRWKRWIIDIENETENYIKGRAQLIHNLNLTPETESILYLFNPTINYIFIATPEYISIEEPACFSPFYAEFVKDYIQSLEHNKAKRVKKNLTAFWKLALENLKELKSFLRWFVNHRERSDTDETRSNKSISRS